MIRICGLDEVGRGAFAGPLVAAAVIIKGPLSGLFENSPVPIRDSKTLSHYQRQRVATYLKKKGVKTTIETISATEINEKGMGWANKEIFLRLIRRMKATKYVVDGHLKLFLDEKTIIESRIKADTKVPQVILASILAKLYRDKLMTKLDRTFPQYHWKENKGYGTQSHQLAIIQYGPTLEHRRLWLETWQKHLPKPSLPTSSFPI